MLLEGLHRDRDRYLVNAIFHNVKTLADKSRRFTVALNHALVEDGSMTPIMVFAQHVSQMLDMCIE
jgi:hypothetical protein